ncbi:hemolysin-like calcium-binding domain-containing protein [Octadecabacter antarcticus 307]|uniref:Hemolysin-like calcium-binding domain-containing protein n=1 Tax=Octadecabacter antarcticus 307 TaxID=391626 RepID=M9RB61_9RHOB|nr:calcium-binding protein [Octadecabacter antarcticus]AGI68983.1 hemolysin-like calcium-binding domain-containing protein [Octadecabacter antarcticus 307]
MTAPTLTGFAPTVTFAENTVNASPQLLDTDVTFTDADGNFDGGSLSLSGLLAEDTASVRNQGTGTGEIGLSGGNVTFGGVTIGTLVGGAGATLTITFNASATSTAIDALIQNLTYANSSDTPTASRDLVLNVVDSAGAQLNAPLSTSFAALTGTDNPLNGIDLGFFSAPTFVDLDGDGDLDIVVGESNGTLVYFENTTPRGEVITVTVTAENDGVTLTGTSGNNTLIGTSELDVLSGLNGNDILRGGAGADTLYGGEGVDWVQYIGSPEGVTVDLTVDGSGFQSASGGDATGDVISGFERVVGSDHADTLTGNDEGNYLIGGAGNDTLIGGAGADALFGGSGIDIASYATSATGLTVRLDGTGSTGNALGDTFDGIENLIGSGGDDLLVGDAGANVLEGGNGDDTLIGGSGADVMHGQSGDDTVTYADSATGVGARRDGLVGWGGAAGDEIFTVENLIGSAHKDTLVGSNGANVIDSGGGGGTIFALGGDDTLIGGSGADVMHGQSGNDTFIFSDSFGADQITDFEVTNLLERIDLSAVSVILDFVDLRDNHINQIGADVVIDDLAGNTITLDGVALAGMLDANNFIF